MSDVNAQKETKQETFTKEQLAQISQTAKEKIASKSEAELRAQATQDLHDTLESRMASRLYFLPLFVEKGLAPDETFDQSLQAVVAWNEFRTREYFSMLVARARSALRKALRGTENGKTFDAKTEHEQDKILVNFIAKNPQWLADAIAEIKAEPKGVTDLQIGF